MTPEDRDEMKKMIKEAVASAINNLDLKVVMSASVQNAINTQVEVMTGRVQNTLAEGFTKRFDSIEQTLKNWKQTPAPLANPIVVTKNWFVRLWDDFTGWLSKKFDKYPNLAYFGGCGISAVVMAMFPQNIVHAVGAAVVVGLSIKYMGHAQDLEDKRLDMQRSLGAAGNEEGIPSKAEILIKRTIAGATLGMGLIKLIGSVALLAINFFEQMYNWAKTAMVQGRVKVDDAMTVVKDRLKEKATTWSGEEIEAAA